MTAYPKTPRSTTLAAARALWLLVAVAGNAGCQEPATEPTTPTAATTPTVHWSRFRGPDGLGICPFSGIPQSWDVPSDRNVAWSTPIPLTGAGSPVLWGSRVYLTGADEHSREVYCLDATSGAMLWRRPVGSPDDPPEPPKIHPQTGYAASSPVTDGERVYAIFPTGHLVCLSSEGALLWQQRHDLSNSKWGHGSSPIIDGERLILQLDQGGPEDGLSRLLALDRRTGATVWETPRPVAGSWTTPILIETAERRELITSAKPWVISYDPETGRGLWRVKCVEGDSAPSPIYAAGLVLVANIYAELTAIRPGGEGDVSQTHVAWSVRGRLPDICSPLSDGTRVHVLTTQGLLSCYRLEDGALLWEHDFKTRFSSSPSLVGDRVYLLSETGTAYIIAAGDEYRELGSSEAGEFCHASFAFAEGRIYLRTKERLVCVEER